MKYLVTAILALVVSLSAAGQGLDQFPRELTLVLDYIKHSDYPEVFDQKYQVRVRGFAMLDMDNDGITEVFLQTFPHYRQTPTITIFQVDSKDSVKRITEGFAPGRLVPLVAEDDYLDSHVQGKGIDLELGSGDLAKMRLFAQNATKRSMSAVIYSTFIHTDQRVGKPIYLDLSYLECQEKTCENFQFQQPLSIVAGAIPGRKEKVFLALTGEEIYCYSIKRITADGLVDKTVHVEKVPADFADFALEQGVIRYKAHDNTLKPFPF